jgi:Fic family protein
MRKPQQPPSWPELLSKHLKRLPEVFKDHAVVELSRDCEAGYWPWDRLRFIARAKSVDPEVVWLLAKLARQPRYRELPLKGHRNEPLRLNVPDRLQHELMLIDQQLAGGLTSDDETPPSASQRERFIISALREEAIASSMLEGAATTRQDAKQMLKSGRRPRSRGEQMVLNNYRAIQFIRENRRVDLSLDFLLELQGILTEKTLDRPDGVGRIRTAQDDISVVDDRDNEVMHLPPPAGELPGRIAALCAFTNQPPDAKQFIHPVIAACVLHFQLGFDHPFCDGNGRTARALFYWMMLRRGYWLFEYLPISRLIYRAPSRYARAFLYCETDEFDVTYFLMYKAGIISRARRELQEYIGKKQHQLAQARHLLSSDRRLNHRQQEVVLQAARNPDRVFLVSEHQSKHRVAYGTARNDLLQLTAWGYLKQVQIGKRYEFTAGEKASSLEA